MRIAVNCAIATRGVSGSERGLEHLLSALAARPDGSVQELWPRRGTRSSRAWNACAQAEWDLAGAARAARQAEVLISPCNIGRARRGQGHVLIVHDTIVLDHPDDFDRGYGAYARALFGVSVRAASVVLVPSRFTELRVRARWPGAPPIVVAGFPLVTERPVNPPVEEPGRVLMVGVTEPRKRHALGIEAVRLARERSGEPLRLAIVGPAGRAEPQITAAAKRSDPRGEWIERLGCVSHEELRDQYERAWLLLAPSRSEGFGLPVGEAAARATPSVHSGNGSLSEVAPGAVERAEDPASYAEAIVRHLEPSHHAAAAQHALEQARKRTPAAYAAALGLAVQTAAEASAHRPPRRTES